jgi:hypothetical protein
VPIPDTPFPRTNSRVEYAERSVARQGKHDAPTVAEWGDEIRATLNKQRASD